MSEVSSAFNIKLVPTSCYSVPLRLQCRQTHGKVIFQTVDWCKNSEENVQKVMSVVVAYGWFDFVHTGYRKLWAATQLL